MLGYIQNFEASTIKRLRPQRKPKNIVKRSAGDEVDIKGLQRRLLMQTEVATCNNTAAKENNLKSKWNIDDRDYFFHLIFVGSSFFNFPNTKSTSQA